MKFRVIHGQHVQNRDTGKRLENGHPVFEDQTFHPGQIVETDVDLTQFNGQGMSPKFERLDLGGARHPLGEVWDAQVETLDQFFDRMKARQTEQHLRATQPQRTGKVDQAPSVSQSSQSAAAGVEGGVSHVPSPAAGRESDQPVAGLRELPPQSPKDHPPSSPPSPHGGTQPAAKEQPATKEQHPPAAKEQHPSGSQPAFAPKNEAELMRHLQGLTVKQLQDLAAEEEIDLKGATTKDAMIKNIRTALKD